MYTILLCLQTAGYDITDVERLGVERRGCSNNKCQAKVRYTSIISD